jgi:hypothetical protein
VPVAREQPQQAQPDLAMTADYQHFHGRQCNETRGGWAAAGRLT